jgi:hypothetical protein
MLNFACFGTTTQASTDFDIWDKPEVFEVFAVTRRGGDVLRNCCKILVNNIKTHGSDPAEILANIVVEKGSTTITLENERGRPKPGNGSGLPMVERQLERIGGRLLDRENRGSAFVVTFTVPTQLIKLSERGPS